MIIIHVTTYILFYCYSCWIDFLLLKFESYIIFIRPQKIWDHIMVWRSRRRRLHILFPLSYFSSSFQ